MNKDSFKWCVVKPQKDLTNQRFNKLLVLRVVGRKNTNLIWECLCDCGNITYQGTGNLKRKNKPTRSCGCLITEVAKEFHKTHGMYKTRAYKCWLQIKQRCSNPKAKAYYWYGARGISYCREWEKFEGFLSDMGHPPTGKEIDRKDNNKGYSAANCHWVTHAENMANRRCSKR